MVWPDCTQPLRVLHVTPYGGDAWAYGGIPRLSDAMACGLAARGHHVTVCTTDACDADRRLASPSGHRTRGAWPPRRTSSNVELRVFPNVSNRLAYDCQFFLPVGLSGYLKRHAAAFDVAHLHACRNLPGVIAARHFRCAGVPYVLAPNGTAPNLERRRAAKWLFDSVFGRRVMKHAARVLAVTEAERRQLKEMGVPEARIRLVPNPLALHEFEPPPAPGDFRRRIGVDGPLIAYLGKLTPRKRVDVLVRAFAQLRAPNGTLVVAGNDMGSGAITRDTARQLGLEGRVVFTGLLQGRTRLELLASADVVVYPSEHEIFGLVPLEALLAGTPVVVAGDSGCGEVIAATGGGLVVDGNADAVRSAIDHILDAPRHWRAAAAEAAKRIRTMYATDVVCSRLEHVYLDVLQAGSSRLEMTAAR
jgi:glycosyltransferase involved in cell wall biosynthesis